MIETANRHLIVVGLGNPGRQYEHTRHNIGFMVTTALANRWGLTFKEHQLFHAWVAKGNQKGVTVHLLMPTTYMNNSGQAVRNYLEFYKLKAAQLIVVVDDISIGFGVIRLRTKGSSGGHNGLKSIEASLQTNEYPRLRMGIGERIDERQHLADYVLSKFAPEESDKLPKFIESAVNIIERLLSESLVHVMSTVNRVEQSKPSQEGQENNNASESTKSL